MKRALAVAALTLCATGIWRMGLPAVAASSASVWRRQAGQQTAPPPAAQTPVASKPDTDEGTPIDNQVVLSVCGDCHKIDSKNRMSRISYRRTDRKSVV